MQAELEVAFDERGHLLLKDAGEVRFSGEVAALLKFEDQDGRLTIVRLTVEAERVTGRVLNQIPLGRIEEAVNRPEVAAEVRSRISYRPPWITAADIDSGEDVQRVLDRERTSPRAARPRRRW